MRQIDQNLVVPLLEPADYQAGIDSDSFHAGRAAHWDLIFSFGVVTGDAVVKLYKGASAGTKTTQVPFRHRLSAGDFGAASADLFASSDTSDADGAVTLIAATYDHRLWVIMLDGGELDDALQWLTMEFSAAADALLLYVVAVGSNPRRPDVTVLA